MCYTTVTGTLYSTLYSIVYSTVHYIVYSTLYTKLHSVRSTLGIFKFVFSLIFWTIKLIVPNSTIFCIVFYVNISTMDHIVTKNYLNRKIGYIYIQDLPPLQNFQCNNNFSQVLCMHLVGNITDFNCITICIAIIKCYFYI